MDENMNVSMEGVYKAKYFEKRKHEDSISFGFNLILQKEITLKEGLSLNFRWHQAIIMLVINVWKWQFFFGRFYEVDMKLLNDRIELMLIDKLSVPDQMDDYVSHEEERMPEKTYELIDRTNDFKKFVEANEREE